MVYLAYGIFLYTLLLLRLSLELAGIFLFLDRELAEWEKHLLFLKLFFPLFLDGRSHYSNV